MRFGQIKRKIQVPYFHIKSLPPASFPGKKRKLRFPAVLPEWFSARKNKRSGKEGEVERQGKIERFSQQSSPFCMGWVV